MMSVKQQRMLLALFFIANLIFLILFADRDGYEGDDLNSILPMFHLAAAKAGDLLIYRYAWQPLSYELGSAIIHVSRNPNVVFLLAPISASIALLILLITIWRDRSSPIAFVKSILVLLCIPELWFCGLYFNSTVLALPCALASFYLLSYERMSYRIYISGALIGLAMALRFDFVLTTPLLLWINFQQPEPRRRLIFFVLGGLSILVVCLLSKVIIPHDLLDIYRNSAQEIADKAHLPGWDLRTKLGVLSVVLTPVGWAILILGGPPTILENYRCDKLRVAAWALVSLPLFVPLPNLLSVKYAIPLLMFVPSFLLLCLSSLEKPFSPWTRPKLLMLATAGSVTLIFFSFNISKRPPYVRVEAATSHPVGTHDGPRSYGGYIWQMMNVDGSASLTPHQIIAKKILQEFLTPSGPDLLVVGSENYFDAGGAAWRDLQLMLEKLSIHGELISPHRLRFEHNGRVLILGWEMPSENDGNSISLTREFKLFDLRASDAH